MASGYVKMPQAGCSDSIKSENLRCNLLFPQEALQIDAVFDSKYNLRFVPNQMKVAHQI